jgi:hypothetical protein
MINEGRLLSRHGFAKANSWITMVLATLLMVAGAVQLVFLLTLGKSGYFEQHAILMSTVFSISLGIVLIILRQFIKPRQIFQLYENGVLVISKPDNKNKFIPFEGISDIYRYRSGKYTRKILNTSTSRGIKYPPTLPMRTGLSKSSRMSNCCFVALRRSILWLRMAPSASAILPRARVRYGTFCAAIF